MNCSDTTGIHRGSQRTLRCGSLHSPDSLFRDPMPGEAITLPNPSEPTGEYLLDKDIITKVAELRTFIEDIEINRGKKSEVRLLERELNKDNCEVVPLTDEEAAKIDDTEKQEGSDDEAHKDDVGPPFEINDATLEPIKEHMFEENMLEEVLGRAFSVYRKTRDQQSVDRLQQIATEMAPVVEKVRKTRAEEIIVRLINCYVNNEEDLNDVLEDLHNKKQLNKYLMKRFDELINLSSQKFRISDKHPAISEKFLRVLKDRVAAQAITSFRGTSKWVRILAECFQTDDCVEYEAILDKHLRKIEDIEDFHNWILDGISYCRENEKMMHRIDAMEAIESIVVKLHPVWTPRDDHIETEDRPYDHPIQYDDALPE